MKYSDNIDYLISAIVYLGSNPHWWGRTPQRMAKHLGLNEDKLHLVLSSFPALFRKSQLLVDNGQNSFSLQARYALYKSEDGEEPTADSDIDPLSEERIKMLLDFVLKMTEHEKLDRRQHLTIFAAIVAAIMSTISAGLVASDFYKSYGFSPAAQNQRSGT